ncbi:MAG: PilZ domain-containing protein [Myxococcota bacterium]
MSGDQIQILILDDGELDELSEILGELQVDHRRLRGGSIGEDLEPPTSLLVATARRAAAVRPGSPPGAPTGRPLRIISTEEDSTPMREMLRRQGYDLLVRRPTHRETWRLLIQRALYQGQERRRDERMPVGSEVELSAGPHDAPALMIDLSNRGGHLLTRQRVEFGDVVSISLPAEAAEGEPLDLRGKAVRVSTRGSQYSVGVLFDRDLSESVRQRLGSLLNAWNHGGESLARSGGADAETAPLPACESPAIPGLTLDDETDPAVVAHVEVGLRVPGANDERRRHRRGPFMRPIPAEGETSSAVLMGRDLSPGGMRIEPLPDLELGDRFEIAIYGPDRPEPFRVRSEVVRDDGAEGLALAFRDVPDDVAAGLEKLVACLPDVESLQAGEAAGLGSIITEIVSKDRR